MLGDRAKPKRQRDQTIEAVLLSFLFFPSFIASNFLPSFVPVCLSRHFFGTSFFPSFLFSFLIFLATTTLLRYFPLGE
jgi:hypothetical protein